MSSDDQADKVADHYSSLAHLMRIYGAKGSPKAFYWAVNEAYHNAESDVYDHAHSGMYSRLGPVWNRLLTHVSDTPKKLRILDVGCGTGLVEHFLNQMCPGRINQLIALDPNIHMLERLQAKTESWGFPVQSRLGDITAVKKDEKFDVVTANSVLHHIVELEDFLSRVQEMLAPGGVFLTAQDTRAESIHDQILAQRRVQIRSRLQPKLHTRLRATIAGLVRRIFPISYRDSLSRATNDQLMQKSILKRPMPLAAIWSVTDFHNPGLPGDHGHGFDYSVLKHMLNKLASVDYFSYQFYGVGDSLLNESERGQESKWFEANDQHGQLFASAWRFMPIDKPRNSI